MKWQSIWGFSQQDYRSSPSMIDKEIQSIKIISSHQSKKMRIIFSNLYGIEPICFSKVIVRVYHDDSIIDELEVRVLGKKEIVIRSGEEFFSDRINIPIKVNSQIEVLTFLSRKCYLTGGITTYSERELQVKNYNPDMVLINQKNKFRMVKDNTRMTFLYGISCIQLLNNPDSRSIIAFGDSLIQQGYLIDALKARLRIEGYEASIINLGIGGNRVLKETDHSEDGYFRHGKAGIDRFESDVFKHEIPDVVIILHGINDFVHQAIYPKTDFVSPEEVIEGLIKYAEICRQYGSKSIIGTLIPLKNSVFYSSKMAKSRQVVNKWIKNQTVFDDVLDFSNFVENKNDVELLSQDYDLGDGLHLSLKGGQKIADKIDLNQLLD